MDSALEITKAVGAIAATISVPLLLLFFKRLIDDNSEMKKSMTQMSNRFEDKIDSLNSKLNSVLVDIGILKSDKPNQSQIKEIKEELSLQEKAILEHRKKTVEDLQGHKTMLMTIVEYMRTINKKLGK